ncbi:MAG: tail fiber domain-containing protein [Mesorhizobium sp.]|uniref:tail fiber domain-containing protein n=1 Tax=Mesorhizobium sp. TaxID=1871066 RepID=UPI000FE5350C|nr:tail fiber domain-containing protein [Mesorhizobium sp.]RWO34735.1 MAG: tail fiber domain-containing protein [Mesorhizobium sp.]
MGKSKAPKPPDPRETSAASTATNVGTAIANANLGNVNQVTPDGNLTYSQSGTYTWKDPYTGKSYDIPKYTATQTLSQQQQAIKNQTDAAELNLGTLANNQSAFLGDYMSKPFDGSNEATEARLMELGRKRLDPMFADRQRALDQKLANQGIAIGSRAYDTAQRGQVQGENDAYNQLLLSGRGQAFSEAQATRNQPINEITALLSGSQVSQPNYVNTNMPTIPTTDTAGLINENYNQKMAGWQQQNAASQGIMGGLFGLGSKLIGLSDMRRKEDIRRIGTLDNGLPVYSYRYRGDDRVQIGVLAQEVEKVIPSAVFEIGGTKFVDHGKLAEAI